jgi:hypothetical protein
VKKQLIIGVIAILTYTAPAFAGQQLDDRSLTDVLVRKGVLTEDDAKAIKHNNDGKLELGAKFYLNTTRTVNTVETATPATSLKTRTTGLNVDRAYLTAKYHFHNNWLARITTDINHENKLSKKQSIFLKYAYVEGKLYGDAAVLRLGQSHTPWIDNQEEQNEHRYVFKTYVDTWGFDDSSDLGIGLKGKLLDGMVGYFVTETNGQGYGGGNVSAGNNGLDFNSRVSLYPMAELSLDIQFRDGFRGTKTFINNATSAGIKSRLFQGQIAYTPKGYGIGLGYVNNKDSARDTAGLSVTHGSTYVLTTAGGGNKELKSDGYYLWARGDLGSGFGAFGNIEYLQNKQQIAGTTNEKINRYVAGLEYSPVKHVTFAAVYDTTAYKNYESVLNKKRNENKFGLYSEVKF